MILKGESAEEFNRKADENYEKYKARQKQNLIKCVLMDFEINEITLQEATKRILLLLDVVGQSEQLCQCKRAQFTRTVNEKYEPMCGRCGLAL